MAGVASGVWLAAAPTLAQTDLAGSRQMRILVGNPPGGLVDIFARALAEGLGRALNRTVIVENRAGAGGTIAVQGLLSSPRDGATMMLASGAQVIAPLLQSPQPYDPLTDLQPVATVAKGGSLILLNKNVSPTTFDDFIIYAKQFPRKVTFASNGIGSSNHLAMELFARELGIELTHLPYRGGVPAMAAVQSGEADMIFIDQGNAAGPLANGAVRVIAQDSETRSPAYPTIPTIIERAPNFSAMFWMGIVVAGDTPPTIVAQLHDLIEAVVKGDAMRQRAETAALQPASSSIAEFETFYRSELEKWRKVIQANNIRAE